MDIKSNWIRKGFIGTLLIVAVSMLTLPTSRAKGVSGYSDIEGTAVREFPQGGARKLAGAKTARSNIQLASTDPSVLKTEHNTPAKDFTTYCSACHGRSGKGDGPAAIALQPKPRNLTDSNFQKKRTDDELVTVILSGKGAMPSFKAQLTEIQIRDLVGYIRTLVKK